MAPIENSASVSYDEDADVYSIGFELDGAFVPVTNMAGTTARNHAERTNNPDRPQTPPE